MINHLRLPCPHNRYWLLTGVVLLCLVILSVPGVRAAEFTVAPSGADFTGIQEAIAWASPGDTIKVESGLYPESLRINKQISLVTPVVELRLSIQRKKAMPLKFLQMAVP